MKTRSSARGRALKRLQDLRQAVPGFSRCLNALRRYPVLVDHGSLAEFYCERLFGLRPPTRRNQPKYDFRTRSGKRAHDFRLTAVRNLERAGVPRSAAMKMVGHKTEAMYRRYAIADESMLREGAAKLEALLEAQRGAFRVGVPLRNDKVSTKSGGLEPLREGLSVAEIAERIRSEMVGRDGIEPPTPGFSVLFPGVWKCA